jgi:hypothetical protein
VPKASRNKRESMPVVAGGGSDRLTISSWQCLPDSFMFGH